MQALPIDARCLSPFVGAWVGKRWHCAQRLSRPGGEKLALRAVPVPALGERVDASNLRGACPGGGGEFGEILHWSWRWAEAYNRAEVVNQESCNERMWKR